MVGDMQDDIMTQVQSLFEEQIKEALKVMQGEIIGIVKEVVNTLVSPLIQQQLTRTLITETRSRKRMGKESIDKSNTDESEEKEHSEEMKGSNSSGDEGAQKYKVSK